MNIKIIMVKFIGLGIRYSNMYGRVALTIWLPLLAIGIGYVYDPKYQYKSLEFANEFIRGKK